MYISKAILDGIALNNRSHCNLYFLIYLSRCLVIKALFSIAMTEKQRMCQVGPLEAFFCLFILNKKPVNFLDCNLLRE